jgi:hypothetical protein
MNILIIISLIIFLLDKIVQYLFQILKPPQDNKILEIAPTDYMTTINNFIRREASIEILKWITEGKLIKNANTQNTSFVSQITNSEELKKRTAVITTIIAEKISPNLHGIFNRIYKKEIETIDAHTGIDISLREYIARYIFFLFRRLSYDITVLINSSQYKDEQLDSIINRYVVGLEETIYKENGIYLVNNESFSDIED